MLFTAIIVSVSAILFLGLITVVNNSRNQINQSFGAASLFISLWITANFLADQDLDHSLTWTRFAFLGAIGGVTCLSVFVYYFPDRYRSSSKYVISTLLNGSFLAVLSFTPLLVENVVIQEGSSTVVEGRLYAIYVPLFLGQALTILWLLGKRYTLKDRHYYKVKYVLYGVLLTFLVSVSTNLILPLLTDSNEYATLGTTSTVFFASFSFFAIFRHKLFDIRSAATRAVAYILASTVVLFAVIILLYTAASLFLDDANYGADDVALFAIMSFISAILFGPSKKAFDSITSRIFYRDAYIINDEIKRLSSLSTSEYDIDLLSKKASTILAESLKPAGIAVLLLDGHGEYYSEYKDGRALYKNSDETIQLLAVQTEKVLMIDEINDEELRGFNQSRSSMITALRKSEVSISLKLSTRDEIVGFVLFGRKLSGNLYSQQDKDFLGIAANEMAVAIQNARRFDEIKRFNETLRLEVDRATKELRSSNEKLQALDQAKDEFISMASHQLRTPLTSVKGYLSMVLEGDVGKVDKQQRDLLAAAFTSSQRMVYLIADLLNVSRLQTGKFAIEPMLCDLPTVVESEIDQLKETARAKNLTISFKRPKKFPDVYLDETKTRQVIMNFIDNAIYYTPNNGKITVHLEATDKMIEYRVEDNGIGVPKTEQKNMFTKFYRATNAKKARPDGTGLGLFMAKKVIVDQGGALIFNSKEGEGSTFGFTFPLTRVRPPKSEARKKNEATKKSSSKAKKSPRKKSKQKQ